MMTEVLQRRRLGSSKGRSVGVVLYCWFFYFVTFPFYVLQSGKPQPSAALAVATASLLLLRGFRVYRSDYALFGLCLAFVTYVAAINAVWFIVIGSTEMLVPPVYYAFNAMLVMVTVMLYRAHGSAALYVTLAGVIAGVMVQVMLVPIVTQPGARQSMFFNNPNQLGYFGLTAATMITLAGRHVGIRLLVQALGFVGATVLVLLSLSKAAIVGTLALAVFSLGLRPKHALLGVLLAGASFPIIDSRLHLAHQVEARFRSFGRQADDSFSGRGYDRLLNHPEHLLFGAGEGAVHRHTSTLSGELHSSWGTLLFSYGLVGSVLFAAFVASALRAAGWSSALIFVPIFLYGLTHQGLRFSVAWIALGVAYCLGRSHGSSTVGDKSYWRTATALPSSVNPEH